MLYDFFCVNGRTQSWLSGWYSYIPLVKSINIEKKYSWKQTFHSRNFRRVQQSLMNFGRFFAVQSTYRHLIRSEKHNCWDRALFPIAISKYYLSICHEKFKLIDFVFLWKDFSLNFGEFFFFVFADFSRVFSLLFEALFIKIDAHMSKVAIFFVQNVSLWNIVTNILQGYFWQKKIQIFIIEPLKG